MKVLSRQKTCKCGCTFEFDDADIRQSDDDISISKEWQRFDVYGDIIYIHNDYTFSCLINTKTKPYEIEKREHSFVRCPSCSRMILVESKSLDKTEL